MTVWICFEYWPSSFARATVEVPCWVIAIFNLQVGNYNYKIRRYFDEELGT